MPIKNLVADARQRMHVSVETLRRELASMRTGRASLAMLDGINVDYYGLVNLVAEEPVATELMQDDLNGDRLAGELLSLLDPGRNEEMRARLREVADQLGEGGASERAAVRILEALREWA